MKHFETLILEVKIRGENFIKMLWGGGNEQFSRAISPMVKMINFLKTNNRKKNI